jgi:hypothetical protein
MKGSIIMKAIMKFVGMCVISGIIEAACYKGMITICDESNKKKVLTKHEDKEKETNYLEITLHEDQLRKNIQEAIAKNEGIIKDCENKSKHAMLENKLLKKKYPWAQDIPNKFSEEFMRYMYAKRDRYVKDINNGGNITAGEIDKVYEEFKEKFAWNNNENEK